MAGKNLGRGKRVDGTGCPHRGGGGGRRVRKVARAKRAVETKERQLARKEIRRQVDD